MMVYFDSSQSFSSPSSPHAKEEEWPAYDEHSRFESATQEVAQHVEVVPEMARTTALSAMAVACQGAVDVAFPDGHVVPTSLNLLTIAETGERKTALENWFFRPIKAFQAVKKSESQNLKKAYLRSLKNWQSGEKALNKLWTKAFENGEPTEEIERRQEELDKVKPQAPRNYQLIYENITPISLAYGLYENMPLGCLLSSEAGNILEGRAMEDLPMLNSIWSGSSLDVTRRTSPSFTLNDPRLSMALMAQPKVIERFLEKRGEEAMDNGFLSRLLVIKPTSMIGIREGKGRPVDPVIMDAFNNRITELLEESFAILESDDRQRRVLQFTPSAKEKWQKMHLGIEQSMVEDGKYYHVRGHGSKLMDNITRVAAIIHTFEEHEGDIDTPLLDYAYLICNSYSRHFIEHIAGDPDIVKTTNHLIREIRRLGRKLNDESYSFKRTVIRQHGRGRHIRKPKHLDASLHLLVQLGHLEDLGRGNFRFSEIILLNVDPDLKNGIDYHIEELPRYDQQEYYFEKGGRYQGFRLKSHE